MALENMRLEHYLEHQKSSGVEMAVSLIGYGDAFQYS